MKAPVRKVRCAIYTRVSTDERLDMEFNSLDAQREAATRLTSLARNTRAGSSSATATTTAASPAAAMDRPALQRLLRDVESGRIDVIVVYKVDRLSRSLTDFARIVEVFEKNKVSFVSITQQFNTTTSMGRLTLNILLSFAQFEREVIGERIRDKFAASRRKGMWMGGTPPLGYDVRDRKLVVNETEAELVRLIFTRFLRVGSATKLAQELRRAGHTTKSWTTQDGKHRPGKPIDKCAIYKILNNRVYLGEAVHKGTQLSRRARRRSSIRATWDKVQAILAENTVARANGSRAQTPALLRGLIFAPGGRAMTPSHSRKNGRLYRYYVSTDAIRQGYSECPVRSVPAAEVEEAVVAQVRHLLAHAGDHRADVGGGEDGDVACAGARGRQDGHRISRLCGTSFFRPSRRASSGCWSSGSIWRPTACRCGCGPRGCRRWSRSSSRGRRRRRERRSGRWLATTGNSTARRSLSASR